MVIVWKWRADFDRTYGPRRSGGRLAWGVVSPIELLGYPVESVIVEKVETMISRGDANTRERDYADVLALSRIHTVGVRGLRRALEQTAIHLSAFCSRGLCSVTMLLMQKPYNRLKVTANNPVNQSMLTLRIRSWEVWHREIETVLTLVRPQPRR
jgi:Nucleotidyl transferase AbiEii toxin, Type IV TA system